MSPTVARPGMFATITLLIATAAAADPEFGPVATHSDPRVPPAAPTLPVPPAAHPGPFVPAWKRDGAPSEALWPQWCRDLAMVNPCTVTGATGGPAEGAALPNAWPGGVVPYTFHANVSADERQDTLDAMAEIAAWIDVTFRPRTSEPNYVSFRNWSTNSSAVGMIGGQQFINIATWVRFVIVHEINHALSLLHEHTRPDRDDFVQINWGNIQPGGAVNFQIPGGAFALGAYDFDSVMHYGQCTLSTCPCPGCPTITVLPPNEEWQELIGQRDHLSEGDLAALSSLYGAIPDDEYEENDTPEDAALVGLGTHDAQLQDSSDYYRVVVAEASTLSVTARRDTAIFDFWLLLQDEHGAVLAFDPSTGPVNTVSADVSPGSYVAHVLKTGGTAGPYEIEFEGPATDCAPDDVDPDCNSNGVLDSCDIATGASDDADGDGVPDECTARCPADVDASGAVDFSDLLILLADWGPCPECAADIDENGAVDFDDLLLLLAFWGSCA